MNTWKSPPKPRIRIRHFRDEEFLVTYETPQGEESELVPRGELPTTLQWWSEQQR